MGNVVSAQADISTALKVLQLLRVGRLGRGIVGGQAELGDRHLTRVVYLSRSDTELIHSGMADV